MKIEIKLHSLVDIITNSSSEIFTIETDKTKEFLAEAVNSFCKENDLGYKIQPSWIDDEEEDWDLQQQIQSLKDRGYEVTKVDSSLKRYVIKIDRDLVYTENLGSLVEFLKVTFNAEVSYD